MTTRRCRDVGGWPVLGLLFAVLAPGFAAASNTQVTTYHYDNQRSGWDRSETTLTPKKVAGGAFGLLHQVTLDEQVDAQPLYVPDLSIGGAAHDVVFVATENNSLYAIDADSGGVLLQRNLGAPVPRSALPGGCNNGSENTGINSTPVIDAAAQTIYVMALSYANATPSYQLHALDLTTLADRIPPVTVAAQAMLADGSIYQFSAANSRQRAALLETNGRIYAGFASFCDINANLSRGWVLGWNANTLTPLAANQLLNKTAHSATNFYLSSVWMSGYGIASDDNGSLFFATGNSGQHDYSQTENLSESVIRLSADLTTVQSFFTPADHFNMDKSDNDLGAGGVLVLPDLPGNYKHLAVAAGKNQPLYLLNRDDLGGEGAHLPALRTYPNGGCWCGQSFYQGSDGVGRIVTSTGRAVTVWKLQTMPNPGLVLESNGPTLDTGQDPGFFTTISSNGIAPDTAIVWALQRPANHDMQHTVILAAFDPAKSLARLARIAAGSWPFAGSANANLVPVVADGHVLVASYRQLSIFGLAPPSQHVAFAPVRAPVPHVYRGTPHDLYGTVLRLGQNELLLRTRDGRTIVVGLAAARASSDVTEMDAGSAVLVRGDYDAQGNFAARFVMHAKASPLLWGPDR